jgi:Serine carboxypeptidase
MRVNLRLHHKICIVLILIADMGVGAFAQGRGGAAAATNGSYRFNYTLEEMQPISYPAQPIATQHQITLHNETIQYTARVGFMPIRHATTGVSQGHLFYIYYSKNGVTDKSKRPVWFLFNGGPGAATIWLHMGAFGPKMVKMNPDGSATPPPYTYVDNPNCLLDTGDLVFIDAMGTGFSRPDKPGYGPDFGGVENDLAAFGEFIRSFLNEYNLWGSPLFVGGESYGTTRAAGLAGYLDLSAGSRGRTSARGGGAPSRSVAPKPTGAPPGAQDAEECLHLLSPHFADVHVMSFRISAYAQYQVTPNHQKKSANVSMARRIFAHSESASDVDLAGPQKTTSGVTT